jgi:photosystem II stability/assembly factor-like uncharacterized protein
LYASGGQSPEAGALWEQAAENCGAASDNGVVEEWGKADFGDGKGGFVKRSSLVLATLICCAGIAAAEQHRPGTIPRKPNVAAATGSQPKFKAIWEPVNYKEDLSLTDVFFASEDVGWVTGDHGTILHTKDGGATWTPQLGGDPQSTEPTIGDLRFADGTHGWANQRNKLLRTTDGENWEEIGKLGGNYGGWSDYFFTSGTVGIQNREQPYGIAQTLDAGKTWKEVLPGCATKMEVEGLTREVDCRLKSLHFPSPKVGYAIGTGSKGLFVLRTEDGGRNWNVSVSPDLAGDQSTYFRQEVFFTNENTGFVIMDDHKIFATTDGGKTWQGRVGTARGRIRFADAEVGWSFEGSKLSYTTNAGKTWSSREFRFPAEVKAFSLPTRSRGYVVGGHGMVYRYRIVPNDYTAKGMIDAPMMPAAPAI